MPTTATEPTTDDFLAQAVAGLGGSPKTLPSKYFYDRRGSELFDRICELPEYYPTRTEMGIMRRHAAEMADLIGPGAALVELGSGSSLKTRVLLDAIPDMAAYIPVDISRDHLHASARRLARAYPGLEVLPLCADYGLPFTPPRPGGRTDHTVVYFPGSTIGNFKEHEARNFLGRLTRHGQALLIGVDLRKSPDVLVPAYDDARGVTAAFNLNLLIRINRELGGDFDLERFAHRAVWNDRFGRVEMHLVSLADQRIRVADHAFDFRTGETIHTECSYKYTLDGFAKLATSAGWRVDRVWVDDDHLFSVQYLTTQ